MGGEDTDGLLGLIDVEAGDMGARHLWNVARQQFFLNIVISCVAVAAAPWASCQHGLPLWSYLAYFAYIAVTTLRSWRLASAMSKQKRYETAYNKSLATWLPWDNLYVIAFISSPLEQLDFFTDVATVVQTNACRGGMDENWVRTWERSPVFWWCAPYMGHAPLWLLQLLTLVFVCILQAFVVRWSGPGISLDLAGALAPAKLVDDSDKTGTAAAGKTFLVTIARVWLEAAMQAALAAIVFELTFEQYGPDARFRQAVSIGLSIATALGKLPNFAMLCCRPDEGPLFQLCAILMSGIGVATLAWAWAKLWFAYDCPSHIWSVTTGCVFP